MGALIFEKYEGLGNDFIVVDARDEGAISPERAVALCDRRRGVGADGVLLVLPARSAASDARMRILNADGSIPEMCGNGLRCVALHLARLRGGITRLRVDTDAGPRACFVEANGMVTVDMGPVRVLGERIVEIDGRSFRLVAADAGNPHAVLFDDFTRADVDRYGLRLATHPAFPNGANVEFASLRDGGIDVVVWERGVGLTQACGTGACATAAVACAVKGLKRGAPIPVRLPGGTLDITVADDETVTMRGPARRVFTGEQPA